MAGVLLGATWAKAMEPIMIHLSSSSSSSSSSPSHPPSYEYSLPCAVAVAEGMKLMSCRILLLRTPLAHPLPPLNSKDSIPYIVPAILLAIANQTLFIGISYLGSVMYQIALQGVCMLVTAVLSQTVLGHILTRRQVLSIVLLTFGFCLLVPNVDRLGSSFSSASILTNPGLYSAILGGFCTAAQGIYFEKASKAQNHHIFLQGMFFSFYGLLANIVALLLLSIFHVSSSSSLLHPFHGYSWSTLGAIAGIAMADISMSFVFKYFDSNTYNFCRVFATWIQGFITFSGVTGEEKKVSSHFVLGSILVSAASIMYRSKSSKPILLSSSFSSHC
ncbi:hypothetical protein GUITHDRAFT_122939 [Guillardia theta CCMP2712]|uniref:EamA domain-containing protein n=1 Tax=Guillardia theta (strain CCMP2712) TaxID=905079 RepID=L1I4Q6_GUITC|nr:hypothetical protein GUITHDRAFT_122939 [Guillardia theta CCMP2712]EKX30854.1 hypothetical protein GUITHDRAFT_122939 [Guillardia theta CCMP2712]|eukprot:XP_005817834.1 hypothetical protein GUITHDRAFT_122939 [Guillardia theta CCMP2712]